MELEGAIMVGVSLQEHKSPGTLIAAPVTPPRQVASKTTVKEENNPPSDNEAPAEDHDMEASATKDEEDQNHDEYQDAQEEPEETVSPWRDMRADYDWRRDTRNRRGPYEQYTQAEWDQWRLEEAADNYRGNYRGEWTREGDEWR